MKSLIGNKFLSKPEELLKLEKFIEDKEVIKNIQMSLSFYSEETQQLIISMAEEI